jgi:hypothetical protein
MPPFELPQRRSVRIAPVTKVHDYRRALRQLEEWERLEERVAVAARPDRGRDLMKRWIADGDAGTRRIMRKNLRKARLARLDGEWVERRLARI